VTDLGAIGILYLMFLAGLSFNMRAFNENRNNAIVYGLLGFFIPFTLSVWVAMSLTDIGLLGAALIGAMWASNTLVAYPDVKAAGLANNRAVSSAVSAGVVADLLSLTVLAIATSASVIDLDESDEAVQATVENPTLPLWLAMPLLIFFCLWLLPRITDWFFVTAGRTRMQRFVFSLAGMAAGAVVALLGGIEGLIGAFLAGLGMNRLIPSKGALMQRLDFVGSAIFVPAFLVSIGLNINPALLFDIDTIVLALWFTGFVVVGKTTAAVLTGLIFKLSWNEVGLMASLSFGQAASTLAIAQVGFSLGMFSQEVVNAAVLAIVSTALITSYGTRFFIKKVPRPVPPPAQIGEAVLVDIRAHGSDLESLMQFSGAIARPDDGLVIPYGIPGPGQKDAAKILVDHATEVASGFGLDSDGVVRVDDSFSDGTLHLIDEMDVSLAVLGWRGPAFATDYVFGNDIDGVGERSTVPSVAARILAPWDRVIVITGSIDLDWHREDAELILAAARRIRKSRPTPAVVISPDLEFVQGNVGDEEEVEFAVERRERNMVLNSVGPNDLVLLPAHVIRDLSPVSSWRATKQFENTSVAIFAGAHRLTISKGVTRRSMQSVVHTQI
ncbi:MAG: cation:proton antiporter, partial [Acidimicrobiia bacterium]